MAIPHVAPAPQVNVLAFLARRFGFTKACFPVDSGDHLLIGTHCEDVGGRIKSLKPLE